MVIAELREQLANVEANKNYLLSEHGKVCEQLTKLDEELKTERLAGERSREKLDYALSALQSHIEVAQNFKNALTTFLGLDHLDPSNLGSPAPTLDLEALARLVAPLLGTTQPVLQVAPLEALKHRFQQEAVDRLVQQVNALEERPRRAIIWLLSVGRPAKHMEICRRLGFPEAGASFTKFGTGIKQAVSLGLLTVTLDGLSVTVREKVVGELEPYSTAPDDIETTYRAVVHALAESNV